MVNHSEGKMLKLRMKFHYDDIVSIVHLDLHVHIYMENLFAVLFCVVSLAVEYCSMLSYSALSFGNNFQSFREESQ